MVRVTRWEFITLLGGATAALPFSARAQQPATPLIGFLSSRSPDESKHLVDAYRAGLRTGGYVEGESVAIEYLWAEGEYDRLPELAINLVRRAVAVLVTARGRTLGACGQVGDVHDSDRLRCGRRSR